MDQEIDEALATPTPIDTDYVILLRNGYRLGVPVKYLALRSVDGETPVQSNKTLSELIRDPAYELVSIADQELDLEQLVDAGLSAEDAIAIYSKERQITNELVKVVSAVDTQITTTTKLSQLIAQRENVAEEQRREEREILDNYNAKLTRILEYMPCPYTQFQVTSKTLRYDFSPIEDPTEMLSQLRTDDRVFYVQYNTQTNQYSKLNQASKDQPVISTVPKTPNHMYILFKFDESVITIDVDTVNRYAVAKLVWPVERCDSEVQSILGIILGEDGEIVNVTETNVTGMSIMMVSQSPEEPYEDAEIEYPQLDTPIKDFSLKYLFTMDRDVSDLIYINERTKLVHGKDKISVHLRAPVTTVQEFRDPPVKPGVTANIVQDQLVTDLKQNVVAAMPHTGYFKKGTYYLVISVDKAESETLATLFIEILSRAIGMYIYEYNTLDDELAEIDQIFEDVNVARVANMKKDTSKFIPSFYNTLIGYGPSELTQDQLRNRGKFLTETFPDVFPEGYARKSAQVETKPMIIPEDKVDEWRETTFVDGDEEVQREVLPFPSEEEPKFFFVCPSDEYPYPGVKLNTLKANRDEYPYLPKCFKKDQFSTLSDTAKYYNRVQKLSTVVKAKRGVTATKVAKFRQEAKVASNISNLLEQFGTPSRMGVVRSPDSFVHAVIAATQSAKYFNRQEEVLSKFAATYRERAAEISSCCSQELYDLTPEQIASRFRTDETVDSSIFYRALEELADVNIYVLSGIHTKNNIDISIEIPRHKNYHARPVRAKRNTLVIYKHVPMPDSELDHPQYEPMKFGNTYLLGPETGAAQFMHDLMFSTLTVQSFVDDGSGVKNVVNPGTDYEYDALFDWTLVSQHIDADGKVDRVTGLYGPKKLKLTVFCTPSQPLNLPISSEISRVDLDLIKSLELIGVSRDPVTEQVIGVWVTTEFGVDACIAVVPGVSPRNDQDLPEKLPPIGLISTGETLETNEVNQYRLTKQLHQINVEILTWLAAVGMATGKQVSEIQELIETREETNYDVSLLPSVLPEVETVEDAIEYLELLYNSVFTDGKMHVHSDHYRYGLQNIVRQMFELHRKLEIPKYLPTRQSETISMSTQTNELVFSSLDELTKWNVSSARYSTKGRVDTIDKITTTIGLETQPVIYSDPNGTLFLIQNSRPDSSNADRAYTMCRVWNESGYVIEYSEDPIYEFDETECNIYQVDVSGDLVLISEESDKPYNLIEMSPGYYSALLPL